jgi:phospholipid/cholesterol/gamma-HCH transport system substrate-binding protein
MENKAHALIAGLFTIVLLAGAIFIGIWLNRDRVQWVPYQIATKLAVPGLNPQAYVRYRGLDVGKVDGITFDPTEMGQILVHISVSPDTPITESTFATLGYQGVTGIAYVQLDDDGSRPTKLPSSKERVARIELRPSILDQLQNRGLEILAQTEEMAKRINTLLEPDNREAMLKAFANVSKAANEIEAIPRQLQPTLAQLPAVTNQAHQALSALTTLSKNASALSGNLQGPLDTITSSAAQLGAAASRLEYEALPLANDARASIRALNRTLDNLNEHPRSLLFGAPPVQPGPGEAGFVAPAQ